MLLDRCPKLNFDLKKKECKIFTFLCFKLRLTKQQDYIGHWWAIDEYTGLERTIEEYSVLNMAIEVYIGLNRLHVIIQDYTEADRIKHGCRGQYKTIQDYRELYRTLQEYAR